jgi:hypothetical protein
MCAMLKVSRHKSVKGPVMICEREKKSQEKRRRDEEFVMFEV